MMKVLATTLFMMVLLEPSFAAPALRRRTTENVESGFANFVASATNNDWMEDSNSTLVVETDSNNTLVEESANSTLIISEEGADDMMEDIDVEEEIPAEEEEEVVVAQPEAPEQAEPESEEVAQPEVAQPEAQPEWEGGEGAQFEDGEGGEEGEEGGNWAKVTRGDCGCQGHCSVCQQFFALCVELYCFS